MPGFLRGVGLVGVRWGQSGKHAIHIHAHTHQTHTGRPSSLLPYLPHAVRRPRQRPPVPVAYIPPLLHHMVPQPAPARRHEVRVVPRRQEPAGAHPVPMEPRRRGLHVPAPPVSVPAAAVHQPCDDHGEGAVEREKPLLHVRLGHGPKQQRALGGDDHEGVLPLAHAGAFPRRGRGRPFGALDRGHAVEGDHREGRVARLGRLRAAGGQGGFLLCVCVCVCFGGSGICVGR